MSHASLDDVLETLADVAGIYGACKESDPSCGGDFCCRVAFVSSFREQIKRALFVDAAMECASRQARIYAPDAERQQS